MRSSTIKGQSALVHAIDLSNLGRMRGRWKGEVGIAACLGEDLHLIVNPAVATSEGIREGPVSMHKCVSRRAVTLPRRQAAMPHEGISELDEGPAGVLRCVGLLNPMV